MKLIAFTIFTFLIIPSCKKTKEKLAQDFILDAMTNGQWVITSFTENTTDITGDFNAYKFQYHTNYTVDAINNGAIEETGNWQGDANSMNISANFTNAAYPVSLINGTWHITNNSWTYVVATITVGNEIRTLRLEKQ